MDGCKILQITLRSFYLFIIGLMGGGGGIVCCRMKRTMRMNGWMDGSDDTWETRREIKITHSLIKRAELELELVLLDIAECNLSIKLQVSK